MCPRSDCLPLEVSPYDSFQLSCVSVLLEVMINEDGVAAALVHEGTFSGVRQLILVCGQIYLSLIGSTAQSSVVVHNTCSRAVFQQLKGFFQLIFSFFRMSWVFKPTVLPLPASLLISTS